MPSSLPAFVFDYVTAVARDEGWETADLASDGDITSVIKDSSGTSEAGPNSTLCLSLLAKLDPATVADALVQISRTRPILLAVETDWSYIKDLGDLFCFTVAALIRPVVAEAWQRERGVHAEHVEERAVQAGWRVRTLILPSGEQLVQ